jgi:hypothetical protein
VPNCDFYAVESDFALVLDFIFDQPGWTLTEAFSRHDLPVRRFPTTGDVLRACSSASGDMTLLLHAPSMGGEITERWIAFKPGAAPGATGRTDADGWGAIRLTLARLHDQQVRPSNANHRSERRAIRWEAPYLEELGPVDVWDWREVNRLSGRLNRFIRGVAVGKSPAVPSRVILPGAAAAVDNGFELALNW